MTNLSVWLTCQSHVVEIAWLMKVAKYNIQNHSYKCRHQERQLSENVQLWKMGSTWVFWICTALNIVRYWTMKYFREKIQVIYRQAMAVMIWCLRRYRSYTWLVTTLHSLEPSFWNIQILIVKKTSCLSRMYSKSTIENENGPKVSFLFISRQPFS